jgi:hypothetical protein
MAQTPGLHALLVGLVVLFVHLDEFATSSSTAMNLPKLRATDILTLLPDCKGTAK